MSTLVSLLIGCVISIVSSIAASWFFTWLYYRRAGEELKNESMELRRLSEMLIRGLHNARILNAQFDAKGHPTSFHLSESVHESGGASESVSATVTRGGAADG